MQPIWCKTNTVSVVATTPTNPFFPNYRLPRGSKKAIMDGWSFETVLLYSVQKAFATLLQTCKTPLHNLGLLACYYALSSPASSPPHPKLVIKSDHKSYNKTRKRVIWLEMTAINLESWEITLLHTLPKKNLTKMGLFLWFL